MFQKCYVQMFQLHIIRYNVQCVHINHIEHVHQYNSI